MKFLSNERNMSGFEKEEIKNESEQKQVLKNATSIKNKFIFLKH